MLQEANKFEQVCSCVEGRKKVEQLTKALQPTALFQKAVSIKDNIPDIVDLVKRSNFGEYIMTFLDALKVPSKLETNKAALTSIPDSFVVLLETEMDTQICVVHAILCTLSLVMFAIFGYYTSLSLARYYLDGTSFRLRNLIAMLFTSIFVFVDFTAIQNVISYGRNE
jgi:uncharacterized protein with PQ loop repeat